MTKNRLTNIILIALAVVAVIQTGGLWLGQTKSHSLFYSSVSSIFRTDSTSKKSYSFLEPGSSAIGIGDNRYILIYGSNDGLIKSVSSSLEAALSYGSVTGSGDTDNSLFSEKSIVLTYPFMVSSSEFVKGLNASGDTFISALSYFDNIVIMPSYNQNDITDINFVNSQEDIYCSVSLSDSSVNSLLRSVIDGTASDDSLIYISSAQSGFNIFKNNVFLPQWPSSEYRYASVKAENACADSGGTVSTATISSMVNTLFSPASPDNSSIDASGIHLYYNDDTVVKYYPNGILEYFSYLKSNEQQTLASAYDACMAFIKKDTSIGTDIYLCDAEATTEGLIFRFDYCVNNIPVVLSPELKEALGAKSAIEVVVNGNTVKKYRKYSYNFILSPDEDMTANVDFLSEINRVITAAQENSSASVQISSIFLGYYLDNESTCALKWITDVNGTSYTGNAYVSPSEEVDTVEPQ